MIAQSLAAVRAPLAARLAEFIFLAAQRDLVSGTLTRRRAVALSANVISALILVSPVVVGLSGVATIWFGASGLLPIVNGGSLAVLGIALRHRFGLIIRAVEASRLDRCAYAHVACALST